jgi:hypothetical protein
MALMLCGVSDAATLCREGSVRELECGPTAESRAERASSERQTSSPCRDIEEARSPKNRAAPSKDEVSLSSNHRCRTAIIGTLDSCTVKRRSHSWVPARQKD